MHGVTPMVGKRQITTMCPMNCIPTQCGMTVEVEDNKLLSVKGDLHNPDSRGFLCIRGRATREIFDNPKRLLHPLRRVGARGDNQWQECSWDEAYEMIVTSIRQGRTLTAFHSFFDDGQALPTLAKANNPCTAILILVYYIFISILLKNRTIMLYY
jgi:anaerobic selenocysteine-containing dehydrogenase